MMIKTFFSRLFVAHSAALLVLAALVACSPDEPTNEINNKLHGDPAKATLVLEVGEVKNGVFSPSTAVPAGVLSKSQQTIVFQTQEEGWKPTPTSAPAFYVQQGQAYRLSIRYTDVQGRDITGQFCTNGQENIHQHFFRLRDIKGLLGSVPSDRERLLSGRVSVSTDTINRELFEYHYADTTPWDAAQSATGGNITGENPLTGQLVNPIGFKGWARFWVGERTFLWQIDLLHARTSKYHNSTCSPYYQPTAGQRSSDHWDLQMRVPVYVFSSLEKENQYYQLKK